MIDFDALVRANAPLNAFTDFESDSLSALRICQPSNSIGKQFEFS